MPGKNLVGENCMCYSTLGSISDVVIVIMFEGTKYLVVGLIGNICAQLALTIN